MNRIKFEEMKAVIRQAFINAGITEAKAEICARVHTESSCDGVYSHGLNRVARFVEYIHKGWVDIHAEPELEKNIGSIETYNGNLGIGILNAIFSMDRAAEMANDDGIGLVAMRNTTHWMRGGTYGWQAAKKGYIAICWTNTESIMPAWGAKTIAIGNNPLVVAVPYKNEPVVLDMAMSQFSYGKLQVTRMKNERLPFPGGFDQSGKLTDIPGPIEETMRILPTGYWKGSGLAIMLDMLSALLSGGLSTAGIDKAAKGDCGRFNQVFMAIDPLKINSQDFIDNIVEETIQQIKSSEPASENRKIFYPGEQSLARRRESSQLGIPVDDNVWAAVKALAGK